MLGEWPDLPPQVIEQLRLMHQQAAVMAVADEVAT